MQRFTQLYDALDTTTRTSEKQAALVSYFQEAPPEDAAWALALLTGRRLRRSISHTQLRTWATEVSSLPLWLIDECYESVGDLSETLALLIPGDGDRSPPPLHQMIAEHLVPLARLSDSERKASLLATWRMLNARQRFVFHKLISGSFRVGVARTLVVRALATIAGVETPIMDHRLLGAWSPTAADYLSLISAATHRDPARPYPFFLASPIEDHPSSLGPIEEWNAEWKWDGIRAQLIRRDHAPILWTRGEEITTPAFPEIADAALQLPRGTVLDGEILAWEHNRPLPFAILQQRLNRRSVDPCLFPEVPIIFMVYDLLELAGDDHRDTPLAHRRELLTRMLTTINDPRIRLSPLLTATTWDDLTTQRESARELGVEGMMLKRRTSLYSAGRTRGDWWKWKVDPFTIDAVLTHAQRGSGRRAGLLTDYTFGLWNDGELVTIAKAYSGLTDEEIKLVDAHLQSTTVSKQGPVRIVKPELVFELAFEAIQPSTRHKSGLALRFPRIHRWRRDKTPAEADTLQTLRAMLKPFTP